MSKQKKLAVALGLGAVLVAASLAGAGLIKVPGQGQKSAKKEAVPASAAVPAITVTAVRAKPADFVAIVMVTGSLVPREEILVGPEVEGLRVIEVLADEGDRVKKGQVLARLVSDTLDAQLAQNDASLARAAASIAQASSNIASAQARLTEAQNNLNRGKPLAKSGYISESGLDQREATAKTAEATLASAKDGLKLAEAEKAQIEAQRRELAWRRGRTDIMAPADGVVSRRLVRIGGYAAGASDAMFRIIAKGEIELDAEIPETHLVQIMQGQPVEVALASGARAKGKVRLVSPEVDRGTRLGRIRVLLDEDPTLRIGSFARGIIETSKSRGLAVPASAVLYGTEGASVQVIVEGAIKARRVKLGLEQNGRLEVREGLAEGDVVVAKSGTFLRDGDAVRPVFGDAPKPGSGRQTANATD